MKMSYDLNILVQQQEKPVELPFQSSIQIKNELQEELRYKDIWNFMTQTKGLWYCLGVQRDELFDAYTICNSDFEIDEKDILMPYWVTDEDVKYNLTPLIVNEQHFYDFCKIIKYMLKQSPVNTLMMLARYQGGENEIVCGVLSYEEFIKLLNERKILFNVCYIIHLTEFERHK